MKAIERWRIGVLGLALLAGACTFGAGPPQAARDAPRELAAVTLNIWHDQEDWPARLDAIVAGLRSADPDVICLQEVLQHADLPNQAETIAAQLGYHVGFASWDTAGSVRRYGNAILSRTPIVTTEQRRLDPPDDYRVILHGRIAADPDTLDVYCTHLHHTPEGGDIRRIQILDAVDFIDESRGDDPVIFAGDFNTTVDAPEMAPVRDRFTDAFGALNPATAGEVTTLNTAKGHRFVRIDHVFFRVGLATDVVARRAEIILAEPTAEGVWPSDHFGVWVLFELQ